MENKKVSVHGVIRRRRNLKIVAKDFFKFLQIFSETKFFCFLKTASINYFT